VREAFVYFYESLPGGVDARFSLICGVCDMFVVSRLGVIVILCLTVSAPSAFSQLLSCVTMQGTWTWEYDNSQYVLTQDGSGNLTGYMANNICPGAEFPITGTVTPGQFTFTATGMYGVCGSSVHWLTFQGWLGQPGCNYVYGNWSNSIPNSGGFGDEDPYPPLGTEVFAKPVDVPDSETSVPPPPAAWNTTQGAPWNQTLAGGLSPSEFEGRGVYEYSQVTGVDTCWFSGSKYAPFNSITGPGYGWYISSRNGWGADWIGYFRPPVLYYRSKKRVPCGSTFTQVMVIDAAYDPDNPPSYGSYLDQYGNLFYGVPYETNTLGGNITATAVQSIRNGQMSTNTSW
jgi:hypothetical protein